MMLLMWRLGCTGVFGCKCPVQRHIALSKLNAKRTKKTKRSTDGAA